MRFDIKQIDDNNYPYDNDKKKFSLEINEEVVFETEDLDKLKKKVSEYVEVRFSD